MKIEAGTVVANGSGMSGIPHEAPFGGAKMSGLGREGSGFSLEEMSELKTIVIRTSV
jgi:acyl-CoA reductase-like NAD-dependent aldehyde dehydrogenase